MVTLSGFIPFGVIVMVAVCGGPAGAGGGAGTGAGAGAGTGAGDGDGATEDDEPPFDPHAAISAAVHTVTATESRFRAR
jgi:hypothetical protein